MFSKYFLQFLSAISLFAIISLLGSSTSRAQTKQLRSWLDDLSYLQNASLEEQQAEVAQIFAGVELWLKLHPGSTFSLPPTPPKPWNAEQMRSLIAAFRKSVESLLERDAGRPFDLGAMEVSVTAETSPLSPIATALSHLILHHLKLASFFIVFPTPLLNLFNVFSQALKRRRSALTNINERIRRLTAQNA